MIDNMKISIFGDCGTGKSALSVRLLTRRYISTYVPNSPTNTINRFIQVMPNAPPLQMSVRDVSSREPESKISKHLSWAHAHIVLLSRDDPYSLVYAKNVLNMKKTICPTTPIILVANKEDLEPCDKVVPLESCMNLAVEYECNFVEISVSQGLVGTNYVLHSLLRQFQNHSHIKKGLIVGQSGRKVWDKVLSAIVKSLCLPAEGQFV